MFCSAQSDSGTSSPGEYSGGLVMAAVNQLRGPQAPALRRFHGSVSPPVVPPQEFVASHRYGLRSRSLVPENASAPWSEKVINVGKMALAVAAFRPPMVVSSDLPRRWSGA